MSVKEILDSANERTQKGNNVTLFAIIGIILVTAIIVAVYMFFLNQSTTSNKKFESAYVMLKEFQGLNAVSRAEMKDKVLDELNMVIQGGSNATPVKKAWFYKGYVHYSVGEYEEAEKIFEMFVKKYKNFYLSEKAYYFLSYTKSELNKNDEAVDLLLTFEKEYKESYYIPLVLFRLGDLYEVAGEKDKAVVYFKKIIENFEDSSQKSKAEKRLTLLENNIQL